jgi:hypothetical protein
MATIIKISLDWKGKAAQFRKNIREQLEYFDIKEQLGGISRRSFILLDRDGEAEPKLFENKHNGGKERINWIEFIGFSRIDGDPMFRLEIDKLDYDWLTNILREHRFNTLKRDGHGVNTIEDKNLVIHHVRYLLDLEDHVPSFYGSIKPPFKIKEIKRVYSENDPYGEEEWEDESNGELSERDIEKQNMDLERMFTKTRELFDPNANIFNI